MQYLLTRIGAQLTEFYAARSNHGDSALRMGWKNREAQTRRFDQLAKVITESADEAFSINDLGCGCGDFSEYLRQRGFSNAAYCGYEHLIDLLIGAGAGVNQTDEKRRSPLLWAVQKDDNGCLNTLLQAGANVDHVEAEGWTQSGFPPASQRRTHR